MRNYDFFYEYCLAIFVPKLKLRGNLRLFVDVRHRWVVLDTVDILQEIIVYHKWLGIEIHRFVATSQVEVWFEQLRHAGIVHHIHGFCLWTDGEDVGVFEVETVACEEFERFNCAHSGVDIFAQLIEETVVDVVGVLCIYYFVVKIEWGIVAHEWQRHAAIVLLQITGVDKPHAVVHAHGKRLVVDYSFGCLVFAVSCLDVDAIRTADFNADVCKNGVGFIGKNFLPRCVYGDVIVGVYFRCCNKRGKQYANYEW